MMMWRDMIEGTFIAGRASERVELAHALKSGRPELIAVYGRRRVGKTYLIRGAATDVSFSNVWKPRW
jgi:AAA+ ATPase superfamily predicted ATPase